MARLRSTKIRARRIQLDYFARWHRWRTTRVLLTLACLAGAAAWVGYRFRQGDDRAYSPGPVTSAHALFEVRCKACHRPADALQPVSDGATDDRPRWQAASEGACRRCHAVGVHETNERWTPPCASCHSEHGPRQALSAVPTVQCTQCHRDLVPNTMGAPRVVGQDGRGLDIQSFESERGHPEFAVWVGHGAQAVRTRLDARPSPVDGAVLRLNHKFHLKPDLPGPAGERTVQLVCGNCHEGPMTQVTARYAERSSEQAGHAYVFFPELMEYERVAAREQTPPTTPGDAPDLAPAEEPAYMAPIRFRRHCAGCHPNTFDPRFPDLPAPHDRPEVVHAFLRGLYADYIVTHADELVDVRALYLGRGGGAAVETAESWIAQQIKDSETLLFRTEKKKCPECHQLEWPDGPAALPRVVPPRVPVRWLPQSVFDHGTHRLLRCAECHASRDSEETTDVLLPRVAQCRSCHHHGGAPTECATCHTYHAATGPKEMDGTKTIAAVVDGGE